MPSDTELAIRVAKAAMDEGERDWLAANCHELACGCITEYMTDAVARAGVQRKFYGAGWYLGDAIQREGRDEVKRMAYDTKCYELADLFLRDENLHTTENVRELAQLIQDEIENFIGGKKCGQARQ